MKKRKLSFLICLAIVFVSGCSSDGSQATIESQKQEIQRLQQEKKELGYLLENEKQKNAVSEPQVAPGTTVEMENETLTSLFKTFITAQFEQDHDVLKTVTSASFYTILVDQAGAYESEVSFRSKVKEIELYQIKELSDGQIQFVGKLTIETQVGDFPASEYTQLIQSQAKKNSSGVYEMDTQLLQTIV